MQHSPGKRSILPYSSDILQRLVVICGLMWSSGVSAQEKPPGIHAFFLHYAIVSHLKERDDKSVSFLMAFRDASPKASISLAQFWWAWGLRNCAGYIDSRIERISKVTDNSAREKLAKQLEEDRDNCIQAFIFDRWNDINASIENKFAVFPRDNN